ncbi:hypothetical protein DEJ47_03170 [Streptomyces venezuelae]|uniref:Uncharacterized protein n=1 Tax=Streptomyces venezuelae TaxID=54571 RepID=A0A5P2B716_STRVZ|nr:hypothetical protein DEJ47_03170 [Streptomyces venezuelae]
MSAPIASRRPAGPPFPFMTNLLPGASAGPRPCPRSPWGQPRVTPQELGLYTIRTSFGDRFSQVRSHWGSTATADT